MSQPESLTKQSLSQKSSVNHPGVQTYDNKDEGKEKELVGKGKL